MKHRPSLSSLMTTKKIAERSRSLAGLIARRGVAAAQPHPDLAMNAPLESLPLGLERLLPSQHVLINAIVECAIEIEKKGRLGALHGLPILSGNISKVISESMPPGNASSRFDPFAKAGQTLWFSERCGPIH